jgi:hypothetical protein
MASNPFDISTPVILTGPKKKNVNISSDITPEDEKDMLTSYVKVNKKYWDDIRPHTHIRYRTNDGVLHVGGMITSRPYSDLDYSSGEPIIYFRLVYRYGAVQKAKDKAFDLPFNQISEIYAKIDGVAQSICEKNIEIISKLTSRILKLEAKLS